MSPAKVHRIEITLSDDKLASLDEARQHEPRASFIKRAIDAQVRAALSSSETPEAQIVADVKRDLDGAGWMRKMRPQVVIGLKHLGACPKCSQPVTKLTRNVEPTTTLSPHALATSVATCVEGHQVEVDVICRVDAPTPTYARFSKAQRKGKG